ncbi:hypothetical protein CMQ_4354 [Grosmannia clavigera kw1407]|uniref:Alcohol acetyltransferase n=1 Tax=Grosmannia clavigera (strain kw1407 / UAMH 11150) TaxID=655863 RepID=F0XUY3_GROCL|nr:uncharacterized protein CMQ_4354 [Grosmannia clavigera kw1407]EFW98502.1 hypothetical protein CMQ_4354 [Grosmannia clavigera kw1407]
MATLPTAVRPLGTFLGLHKGVITVCRYAVPTSVDGQPRTKEQVRARVEAAVAVVIGQLGALRTGIAGEETRQPQFVAVASVDVREHVEWRGGGEAEEKELERQLEDECGRSWPDLETHPPWRLLGFNRDPDDRPQHIDLAFAAHHALADGKSGQVFHRFLVEALNEGETMGEIDSETNTPTKTDSTAVLRFDNVPLLAPPQEQLVRFTVSWGFFARTLWNELGLAWLKRAVAAVLGRGETSSAPVLYTGDQPIRLVLGRTRVCLLSVAPPDLAALLAACRVHGTTLTPLLHGLLLVAATAARRKMPLAGATTTFSGTTPISLRGHVTQPKPQLDMKRTMGNYVSAYRHVFSRGAVQVLEDAPVVGSHPDAALWEAVAEVDVGLRACTADVTRDSVLGLLAWVRDWHGWFRGKAGQLRDDTWEVSNVGTMDNNNDNNSGGWHLTRSLFVFTAPATGPLLELTAASVHGGPLTLALVRQQGSPAEEQFCEEVWADVKTSLWRFRHSGRFMGE